MILNEPFSFHSLLVAATILDVFECLFPTANLHPCRIEPKSSQPIPTLTLTLLLLPVLDLGFFAFFPSSTRANPLIPSDKIHYWWQSLELLSHSTRHVLIDSINHCHIVFWIKWKPNYHSNQDSLSKYHQVYRVHFLKAELWNENENLVMDFRRTEALFSPLAGWRGTEYDPTGSSLLVCTRLLFSGGFIRLLLFLRGVRGVGGVGGVGGVENDISAFSSSDLVEFS